MLYYSSCYPVFALRFLLTSIILLMNYYLNAIDSNTFPIEEQKLVLRFVKILDLKAAVDQNILGVSLATKYDKIPTGYMGRSIFHTCNIFYS